jgi:hypothetical protein
LKAIYEGDQKEKEHKGTDWFVYKVAPLASLPLTDVKRSEMEKQAKQ